MESFNSPIQGYEGWNVNASYMTPAYMANFRPGYGDNSGRPNAFAEKTRVRDAVWRAGPGEYQRGRNVAQDMASDRNNMVHSVSDAGMSALQMVAIPASTWYIANKFNNITKAGSILGRAGGHVAARTATGVLGAGMRLAGMRGIADSGAARSAAGLLGRGAGALGGLAGSAFFPITAGIKAAEVLDKSIMDPYVSTRRGMDAMMSNTANQFISGEGGAVNGAFGMSAVRAQKISHELTKAGGQDRMLETGEYNEIADNMMRAGMFQEVGDMDTNKIVDGVKKATSVLKLIQRITGDADIKEGIQTLATLKAGGLDDIHQMGLAVNQLRSASASSGVNMNQLLSTIGNQGAMMAQQQGISGNSGMLASIDAFAGFTNARRAGLISGTEASRLGGVEGMTQNMMGGAYAAMNTGYGRMALQGGGDLGDSLVSNISKWSGKFSGNPLAVQGDWIMNGATTKEESLNTVGAKNTILKMLQSTARTMNLDPNDARMLAAISPSLGISEEQLRSVFVADRAMQDPKFNARMVASDHASILSDTVTEMQNHNEGLMMFPILGDMQKSYNETAKGAMYYGSKVTDGVTSITSNISDTWTRAMNDAKGLVSLKDKSSEFTDEESGRTFDVKFTAEKSKRYAATDQGPGPYNVSSFDYIAQFDKHDEVRKSLAVAAQSNDSDIKGAHSDFVSAMIKGTTEEKMEAFKKLDDLTKGGISGMEGRGKYAKINAYQGIEDSIEAGEFQIEAREIKTYTQGSDEKTKSSYNMLLSMENNEDKKAAIDSFVANSTMDQFKLLGLTDKNFKSRKVSAVNRHRGEGYQAVADVASRDADTLHKRGLISETDRAEISAKEEIIRAEVQAKVEEAKTIAIPEVDEGSTLEDLEETYRKYRGVNAKDFAKIFRDSGKTEEAFLKEHDLATHGTNILAKERNLWTSKISFSSKNWWGLEMHTPEDTGGDIKERVDANIAKSSKADQIRKQRMNEAGSDIDYSGMRDVKKIFSSLAENTAANTVAVINNTAAQYNANHGLKSGDEGAEVVLKSAPMDSLVSSPERKKPGAPSRGAPISFSGN